MNFSGIGDLAQNLLLRRQSGQLQTSLSEVTRELVTGKKSDLGASVKGDYGPLASYQRSIQVYEGYAFARQELDVQFTGIQTALGGVHSIVTGIGTELLAAISLGYDAAIDAHISDAASRFESAVLQLNSRVGDRYLLSGENSTTPPIAEPNQFIAALKAATAAATTQADFDQAIDDWFDLPGGFDTVGYLGGATQTESIRVGPNQVVSREITAASDGIKTALRNLSALVLIEDGAFATQPDIRSEVARNAALGLIEGGDQITDLRAVVGVQESLLSSAEAQIEAEKNVFSQAQSKLTDADPFKAASELEALQVRIETLYTITARNSRLNLMEYLR